MHSKGYDFGKWRGPTWYHSARASTCVFLFSYPLIPLAAVRRVSQTCRLYDPAWVDFEGCQLSIYISTGALRNPEIRDEVESLCDGVCS